MQKLKFLGDTALLLAGTAVILMGLGALGRIYWELLKLGWAIL
jgi:hypothetical protein